MKRDHIGDGIAGMLGALAVMPIAMLISKSGLEPYWAFLLGCPLAGAAIALQSWAWFGRKA